MIGMMTRTAAAGLALALVLGGTAWAENQPYAGQDTREIASLSAQDIEDLLAGRGWGLAKPAELNGYPGPLHVLELADEIGLNEAQLAQITAIRAQMTRDAQAAGRAYVDAEAYLSTMFRTGHANADRLEAMLQESAEALARLRAVHLNAHLETAPLLSDAQKETYAALRGYGSAGDGHDGHSGHSGH